jgi:hypothetical protein
MTAFELSCLGCGQIGTPSTWHEPSGVYLCAERCVPAIRLAALPAKPDVGERLRTALREAFYKTRQGTGPVDEIDWPLTDDECATAIVAALTEQEAGRE